MSTSLLDSPTTTPPATSVTPAQRLRTSMAAVALHFTWFGVRKSLNNEQKAQAADTFGAEGNFLSAGKKLIDTRHEAYKAVTALRTQITQFWRAMTLPYPEPGIRLIRRDDIELFDSKLTSLREELFAAVTHLDQHFGDLKAAARQRLGRLYNQADYPGSLLGLFSAEWTFPNVEAPAYLQQLSVQPQTLRDNQSLRQRIASQLAGVQSQLDGLLVDRPRRNILRRPR